MITDLVITQIETKLAAKFKSVNIVPESEAYPTSGSTFMRVTGDATDIQYTENTVNFRILFSVITSIRTRHYPIQLKRTPYLVLIDLQEQSFFHLTAGTDMIAAIRAIADNIEVIGRFTSDRINTRIQSVREDFFGSTDKPDPVQQGRTRHEAGFVISQSYTSPQIVVPFQCFTFPDPLDNVAGQL